MDNYTLYLVKKAYAKKQAGVLGSIAGGLKGATGGALNAMTFTGLPLGAFGGALYGLGKYGYNKLFNKTNQPSLKDTLLKYTRRGIGVGLAGSALAGAITGGINGAIGKSLPSSGNVDYGSWL